MSNYKYVWLNIKTGKFSNTWSQEEHDKYRAGDTEAIPIGKEHSKTWKLIKFKCLTDESFMFTNLMKLK